jgi:hypothetical protein
MKRLLAFTVAVLLLVAAARAGPDAEHYLDTFIDRTANPHDDIFPFYEAFGVRPGDRMYRPDSVRVQI